MMDVSIRDMETESVTVISIIKIFHRLLSRLCCKGCQMGHNGAKNAFLQALLLFLILEENVFLICLYLSSMEESPVVCIYFSLSWCGGYAGPIGSTDINLFNQLCSATLVTRGREKWTYEMPWINLSAEALYGYIMYLVFREVNRKKIRMKKRWGTEIEKGLPDKKVWKKKL